MHPSPVTAGGPDVEGAAYGLAFRVLTVGFVAGLTVWMGVLMAQGRLELRGGELWLAAWVMLLAFAVAIWRSRSGIRNGRLYQRLFWVKEVAEADIAYARMVRIPGFSWLIAPRLYVRTHGLKILALYAADAHVLARFEQVVARHRTK